MKKTISKVAISPGNSKIGKIPAVSLPPITSCRLDAPCKKDCYALKSFRMYPNVRSAWQGNLDVYQDNPGDYFDQIDKWIKSRRKPVKFFRFHVSGDIVDNRYFEEMILLADINPEVRFLAFTKQYEIVNSYLESIAIPDDKSAILPDNLTIIFSAWPGFFIDNPYCFPVAYMQDGTEDRLDGTELECPGNCETCGMCWQLPKLGKNVVFNKH